jgi:hypothetical protein
MGFTLPLFNHEMAKDIKNMLGGFRGSIVTDEFVHGTTMTDHIEQGVDKLGTGLDTVDID